MGIEDDSSDAPVTSEPIANGVRKITSKTKVVLTIKEQVALCSFMLTLGMSIIGLFQANKKDNQITSIESEIRIKIDTLNNSLIRISNANEFMIKDIDRIKNYIDANRLKIPSNGHKE